jgi:hypothetical protein
VDNTLGIHIVAFGATRDFALGILTLSHAILVLVAARFGTLYRDALAAAETRSFLQTWQLRQLVPDEASRAIDVPDSTARPQARAST